VRHRSVIVASLACAIGLNILIFCFTSPALLKPLPYPDPDMLMDVGMAPPGKPEARGVITPALGVLLRDRTSAAFEAIGVFDGGRSANLAGDAGGPALRLDGHRISASGLAALGTKPLLGRLPIMADEAAGATSTMVLGYPTWQRRFGGRADVVGQTVMVDGQPTQIIGVMPEGFGLLDNSSDAWFTFGFEPTPAQQFQHSLRAAGRLKPGVSIAQGQAAVKVALDEYARTFPDRDQGWTVEIAPWREARFGGLRRPLTILQLAVGGMLLLLCVSLAVLLRASTALRPGRILALSLAGGAIGAGLTAWALPELRDMAPTALPRLVDVAFDARAIVFSVALCVVAALIIRIVPGRLGAALLPLLLAVQMALAFVLMAGTGLAMRAVGDLRGRDVGVNPAGLLSADVYLPRDPYVMLIPAEPGTVELAEFNAAGPALYDRIREALQTLPGVVQAAGMGTHPFASNPFVQCFVGDAEHTPDNRVNAQYLAVTENYFNTMGVRIVRGRDFSAADRADSPWVVLVNETLAKQQWPNGDPIGQKVTLTFQPNDEEPQRDIIGVVADTIPFRGASEVPPLIYVLHRQQATQQRASLEGRRTVMSFIVRTSDDPLALGDAVRAQVGKVDATTPVASVRTVEFYLNAGQTSLLQFAGTILGIFGLVALVACAAGVYSLTAFGVTQGRKTITLVLLACAAAVVGAAAGLYAWLKLGSVIASFLTNLQVTPADPMPLVVTGCVLLAVTLVACLVPARVVRKG
jgi:putative ABC transport system permease protein